MEEKVINLYLSGYGSTTIIKMLPISKRKVLKILNDNGLIKKNNYNGYIFKDGKWWYYYICDECNSKIECYANEKYLLHRCADILPALFSLCATFLAQKIYFLLHYREYFHCIFLLFFAC